MSKVRTALIYSVIHLSYGMVDYVHIAQLNENHKKQTLHDTGYDYNVQALVFSTVK